MGLKRRTHRPGVRRRPRVDAAAYYADASCRGKVPFRTEAEATAAARKTEARPGRHSGPGSLHAYACRTCGQWHVGHVVPRRYREVPPPLKRIVVAAGDVVEITWRRPDGSELRERRTMPAKEPDHAG